MPANQSEQRQFIADLKSCVQAATVDPKINQLFDEAAQDPTRYSEILERMAGQIYAARNTILYPNQPSPSQPVASCYRPDQRQRNLWCWERLVSDTAKIAQKLAAIEDPKREWYWACQVVLALRLMLSARLYAFRADYNERVKEIRENPSERSQDVVKKFLKACSNYDTQVHDWGLDRKLPPGWKEHYDAIVYNTWSHDFGKGSDAEIGWSPFAQAIGPELRYQSHRMRLRHLWSTIRSSRPGIETARLIPLALLLGIFKATAGFGFKPARFAATVCITILTFSTLYFLDDVLAPCGSVTWSPAAFGGEIYSAIANFTSVGVGGNSGPCGPFTGLLISVETLFGYFLLSVLAAMLVARIIDY